jgi:AraC-like DNA-binding protein
MDSIRKINEQVTKDRSAFENIDTHHGAFWLSQYTLENAKDYISAPPPGLHLGGGISSLVTHCGDNIKRHCIGPVITLLNMPATGEHDFQTHVNAGEHLSCGLFIDRTNTNHLSHAINKLLSKFSIDELYFFSASVPANYVYPLCAPMHYWTDKESYQLAAESRALSLIALVLRQHNGVRNPLKRHQHQKLIKVRALINSYLAKPISLNWLAHEVGLSTRSLTGLFKSQFGLTINDYLIQQRMQQAMMMLEQGQTVSYTADKVGYSLPHFSNKFRQTFGISAKMVNKQLLPNRIN